MVFKFLSLTFSFHSLCYIYFSLMLSWLGNLSIYFCYLPFALYLYTFFSSVALWIILLFLFLDSPCAEICIVNYCKTVIVQYCCCNLYIFIVSSRVGTPPFLREPPLSEANLKSYPSFWEPSKLVHVNCKKHFKIKVLVSYYTKSIENIINITLFTFRLNSVFTTDISFG